MNIVKKILPLLFSVSIFVFFSSPVSAESLGFSYESVAPAETSVSVSVAVTGQTTEDMTYSLAVYRGSDPIVQLPLVDCYANESCESTVQKVFYGLTADTEYDLVIADLDGVEYTGADFTFRTTGGAGAEVEDEEEEEDPNELPAENEYYRELSFGTVDIKSAVYDPNSHIATVQVVVGGDGIYSESDLRSYQFIVSLCDQSSNACEDSDVVTAGNIETLILPLPQGGMENVIYGTVSASVTPPRDGTYSIKLKTKDGTQEGIVVFTTENNRTLVVAEGEVVETTAERNRLKNPLNPEYDSIPKVIVAFLDNIILPIAVPFVALAIIWVGFQYVLARGDTTKLQKAHDAAKWTAIGAAVVLGAFVISKAIEGTINQIRGTVERDHAAYITYHVPKNIYEK